MLGSMMHRAHLAITASQVQPMPDAEQNGLKATFGGSTQAAVYWIIKTVVAQTPGAAAQESPTSKDGAYPMVLGFPEYPNRVAIDFYNVSGDTPGLVYSINNGPETAYVGQFTLPQGANLKVGFVTTIEMITDGSITMTVTSSGIAMPQAFDAVFEFGFDL